jgi:plastocyanin
MGGAGVAFLCTALVVYAAGEQLPRSVAAGGGGRVSNSQFVMQSAIGQPLSGSVGNSQQRLCTGYGCRLAPVTGSDEPILGLNAGNSGPSVLGTATNFTATVTGGSNVTYTWQWGDGTSGSGPSASHTYGSTGVFTATVTAGNGAGTVQATTVVHVAHAVVEVRNNSFAPAAVTILPGQSVAWVRREGVHNVAAGDGSFSSGAATDTWHVYRHTFAAAGTYPYRCDVHGAAGMTGVVEVQAANTQARVFLPLVVR